MKKTIKSMTLTKVLTTLLLISVLPLNVLADNLGYDYLVNKPVEEHRNMKLVLPYMTSNVLGAEGFNSSIDILEQNLINDVEGYAKENDKYFASNKVYVKTDYDYFVTQDLILSILLKIDFDLAEQRTYYNVYNYDINSGVFLKDNDIAQRYNFNLVLSAEESLRYKYKTENNLSLKSKILANNDYYYAESINSIKAGKLFSYLPEGSFVSENRLFFNSEGLNMVFYNHETANGKLDYTPLLRSTSKTQRLSSDFKIISELMDINPNTFKSHGYYVKLMNVTTIDDLNYVSNTMNSLVEEYGLNEPSVLKLPKAINENDTYSVFYVVPRFATDTVRLYSYFESAANFGEYVVKPLDEIDLTTTNGSAIVFIPTSELANYFINIENISQSMGPLNLQNSFPPQLETLSNVSSILNNIKPNKINSIYFDLVTEYSPMFD